MGYRYEGDVIMVRIDMDAVYVHGAFAKHCQDQGIRGSRSPYLKQIIDQAERHFEVVTGMALALLKISCFSNRYWSLAVQHATYLNNRSPCGTLYDRPFAVWNVFLDTTKTCPTYASLGLQIKLFFHLVNVQVNLQTIRELEGMLGIRILTASAECLTKYESSLYARACGSL